MFFAKKKPNRTLTLKVYVSVDFRDEHLGEKTHYSETIALLSDYISKLPMDKGQINTRLQALEQGTRVVFDIQEPCKNFKQAEKKIKTYSKYLTNLSAWLSDYDTSVFDYGYQIYLS